jgi:two-component system LytT family response regulator
MNKIRTVIVDDELLNRSLIKTLISNYGPEFNVCGEAENLRDAHSMIQKCAPQVVFLDIKMPDGSGFDLLKKFPEINFEIVFVTGFDEYALAAFDHNALDYILKPIDIDKFKSTLQKIVSRLHIHSGSNDNEPKFQRNPVSAKIPIHFKDQVVLLNPSEIMYLRQTKTGTDFYIHSGEIYSSGKTIEDFKIVIDKMENFVPVNGESVININFVSSYLKSNNPKVIMRDKTEIEISYFNRNEIIKILDRSLRV